MKDGKDRLTQEMPISQPMPGRPRTSRFDRREQNTLNQRNRRQRMLEAGFKYRGFWLSPEAHSALVSLQAYIAAPTLDETAERVIIAMQRLAAAKNDDPALSLKNAFARTNGQNQRTIKGRSENKTADIRERNT